MKYPIIIAVWVLLTVSVSVSAAHATIFTLNEALSVAYETNPRLEAQRASLRAQDEDVARANAGWHPTVTVSGGYGYGHTQAGGILGTSDDHPLNGQVSVSQPIFRGDTIAEISKAKALVEAGRAQLTQMEENVLLDAVTAYMNVVRDTAILVFQRKNVTDLKGAFEATHSQVQIGTLSRTDEAQAQARLLGAEAAASNAEAQLAISRSGFAHVIGRPAETLEIAPPYPTLPKSVDQAVQLALRQNPTLVAAQQNVKAAEHAVDSATGALMPQFSIVGEYQYTKDSPNGGFANLGNNHFAAVLGQITVPIYQGGGEYAAVRQSKELRNQSKQTADEAYRQAEDTTHMAWQGWVAAQATISDSKAQVDANSLAYQGVTEEQRSGARTVLDTLNAKQELVSAQIALENATHDSYVTAYQVLSATGQLTARQQRLNVKLYDPTEHYDDDAGRWIGLGN